MSVDPLERGMTSGMRDTGLYFLTVSEVVKITPRLQSVKAENTLFARAFFLEIENVCFMYFYLDGV